MFLQQEKELIRRCKQQDEVAFGILLDRYQNMVFGLACRLLCDEEEAKDVVQETFLRMWIHISGFNERAKLSTWICSITVNICNDYFRKKRCLEQYKTKKIEMGIPDVMDISDKEGLENKELIELIAFYTEGLSPKQKVVFVLRDLEGFELEEVARITGLSGAKIKSNLYLARKYIREKLKEI